MLGLCGPCVAQVPRHTVFEANQRHEFGPVAAGGGADSSGTQRERLQFEDSVQCDYMGLLMRARMAEVRMPLAVRGRTRCLHVVTPSALAPRRWHSLWETLPPRWTSEGTVTPSWRSSWNASSVFDGS